MALAAILVLPAAGQVTEPDPDEIVEAYAADLGLREVRGAMLRRRLASARPGDQVGIATLLSDLYTERLSAATSVDERQRLLALIDDLLEEVPDARSTGLRIELARARYLRYEQAGELARLRLIDPDEQAEALAAFLDVAAELRGVVNTLDTRMSALERSSRRRTEEAADELADVRRRRSLAGYYAGWAGYYAALLGGGQPEAERAVRSFGVLLNAERDGRPVLDRLPVNLLRFEHVSRAAIGVALGLSLRGETDHARSWLREIEAAELPASVRDTLFQRRAVVFAEGRRWDALESAVEARRGATAQGFAAPPRPLTPIEARLIAVLLLERAQDPIARDRPAVTRVLNAAVTDLVLAGEVDQLVDLTRRFGTVPLADDGFVATYVRGVRSWETARAAHEASGRDLAAPVSGELARGYREAARLLRAAITTPDAMRFPPERQAASIRRGRALYFAGESADAATALYEAYAQRPESERSADALWLALAAVNADPGRRKEYAAIFLRAFPEDDRAATLLLGDPSLAGVTGEAAADVLAAVPESSPAYEAAQWRLAGVLYARARAAPAKDRAGSVAAFLEIAERTLMSRLDRLATATNEEQRSVVARAVVDRARQMLDAATLSLVTPDLPRARTALAAIERVRSVAAFELAPQVSAELDYRALQIAAIERDDPARDAALTRLASTGGRFRSAGGRFLYNLALSRWRGPSPTERDPADLVVAGDQLLSDPQSGLEDREAASVRATMADASAAIFRSNGDLAARDRAIELDAALLRSGLADVDVLLRLADLAEQAERHELALDAWRRLLKATRQGTDDWYEARTRSLVLLAGLDPEAARAALDQHALLYPDLAPEPWGDELRQLDRTLPEPEAGR